MFLRDWPPDSTPSRQSLPGFATVNKPVNVTAGGNLVLPIQMVVAADKQEITVADSNRHDAQRGAR